MTQSEIKIILHERLREEGRRLEAETASVPESERTFAPDSVRRIFSSAKTPERSGEAGRKAIAVTAAVAAALSVLTMTAVADRFSAARLASRENDGFTEYRIEITEKPNSYSSTEPTWIPEGYELDSRLEDSTSLTVSYKKDDSHLFVFICSPLNTTQNVNSEKAVMTRETINGEDADVYDYDYSKVVIWIDNLNGNVSELVSYGLSTEDTLKIARSVQ